MEELAFFLSVPAAPEKYLAKKIRGSAQALNPIAGVGPNGSQLGQLSLAKILGLHVVLEPTA